MQNNKQNIFFSDIKKDIHKDIHNNKNNVKNMISRIKIEDFYIKNEINASTIIKSIFNYNKHFHIILKYSYVNISEVGKTLGLIKRDKKEQYMHCSYSFHNNNFMYFDVFFIEINNNRKIVLNLINSFKYLMKSLEILWHNKIVHFKINPQSILFDQLDNPYITDFTHSFSTKNLNEERKSNLFLVLESIKGSDIISNSSFIPIEAYIISFLNNQSISLSKTNIDQICTQFFNEILNSFEVFSIEELEKYKEYVIFSLQIYINKSKDVIIKDLITNYSWYWDIYSLYMTYLFLLKKLEIRFNICQFYEDFFYFLKKNIFLLFLQKETLTHSFFIEKFEKIIENCDFDDLIP